MVSGDLQLLLTGKIDNEIIELMDGRFSDHNLFSGHDCVRYVYFTKNYLLKIATNGLKGQASRTYLTAFCNCEGHNCYLLFILHSDDCTIFFHAPGFEIFFMDLHPRLFILT
jgi:hypothetical protein